jgi:hypothetical protein
MSNRIKGLVKLVLKSLGAAILVSNITGYCIIELKLNNLYWNQGKRAAHDKAELIIKGIPLLEYPLRGGEIFAASKYHYNIEHDRLRRFSPP